MDTMEVTATHDFVGQRDFELSFRGGDVIQVLKQGLETREARWQFRALWRVFPVVSFLSFFFFFFELRFCCVVIPFLYSWLAVFWSVLSMFAEVKTLAFVADVVGGSFSRLR